MRISSIAASVAGVVLPAKPNRFLGDLDVSFGPARRGYALGLGALVVAAGAFAATRIGRGAFDGAVSSLAEARPGWLVLAGAGFAAALLSSAAAWRAGLGACGGCAGYGQVSARYAVGSLVNSVAPAHVGGAVRLGLMSQTLPGEDRLWRAGGIGGVVAAARTLALAALIVAAAVWGGIPLWPAPILIVVVLLAVGLGTRASHRVSGRLGSLLEVLGTLHSSPGHVARLVAWVLLSFGWRILAAAAIVVSLGVPNPVFVALVLLAAFALAGLLPLTPGNFGAGAGAATLALHGTGVGVGTSLATGVAFQAVETFAGVTLGLAGATLLASPGSAVRRWSLAAAGVGVVLAGTALGVATVELV